MRFFTKNTTKKLFKEANKAATSHISLLDQCKLIYRNSKYYELNEKDTNKLLYDLLSAEEKTDNKLNSLTKLLTALFIIMVVTLNTDYENSKFLYGIRLDSLRSFRDFILLSSAAVICISTLLSLNNHFSSTLRQAIIECKNSPDEQIINKTRFRRHIDAPIHDYLLYNRLNQTQKTISIMDVGAIIFASIISLVSLFAVFIFFHIVVIIDIINHPSINITISYVCVFISVIIDVITIYSYIRISIAKRAYFSLEDHSKALDRIVDNLQKKHGKQRKE